MNKIVNYYEELNFVYVYILFKMSMCILQESTLHHF